MVNLRPIEPNDMRTLLAYGKYFWKQTPYVTSGMKYNSSCVKGVLNDLRDNHYLRVYDHPVHGIIGFIGLFIHPILFNDEYLAATEVFFFIHPDHRERGRARAMLTIAETALKEDGVDIISMGEMKSSTDMTEWYKGEGYTLSEQTYVKVL